MKEKILDPNEIVINKARKADDGDILLSNDHEEFFLTHTEAIALAKLILEDEK